MNTFEDRILEHINFFITIEIIGALFVVLILIETIYDYVTGRRSNLKESAANGVIEIGNRLLERTIVGTVFIIGLLLIEPLAVFDIPFNTWSWLLAVILADFSYYWMHRSEHQVRFLWALHSTHHSSHEYNLTTSFRLSWLESLFEWVFFIPMIIIGFDVIQTLGALLIVVLYQTWIHTEKIKRLGLLDRIFNTPSVHRVHHATNPQYIDKNYGGILILWDRLFGTYKSEKEPVVYGITVPLNTSNPVTINFQEFSNIAKDIKSATTINEALGYLFNRPGWKPESKSNPG